ncbi:hypothetical protein P692DRAFT_20921336 [Suillus brevipes Sb2]|nr:hypothetical protein P692DRAFT_20921336 [Suillus brevipes Sb2]
MNEPEVLEQIPLPLETIRQGYNELGHHTHVVLRTQLGDSARLNAAKRECLRFIGIVEQHANVLSQNELLTIQTSIYEMLDALDVTLFICQQTLQTTTHLSSPTQLTRVDEEDRG